MSCSQVKPMPPCTWMASPVTLRAASEAYALAMAAAMGASGTSLSTAQAAWYVSDFADSTATSMSAHLCDTAWYDPMGRPNCWRVLAYSTLISMARWATPQSSALIATRARSMPRRRTDQPRPSPPTTRSAETVTSANDTDATRRVWSIVFSWRTVTPGAAVSTTNRVTPSPSPGPVRAATSIQSAMWASAT